MVKFERKISSTSVKVIAKGTARDAWKKLEGMSKLEAKHRYVDTLLKAATEVSKHFSLICCDTHTHHDRVGI